MSIQKIPSFDAISRIWQTIIFASLKSLLSGGWVPYGISCNFDKVVYDQFKSLNKFLETGCNMYGQ